MSIWEFWHGTAEVARAHAETRTCTYVKTVFPNPKEAGLNVCRSESIKEKSTSSLLYILSVCGGELVASPASHAKTPLCELASL